MKVRQILKQLKKDGWVEVRQRGSHRQFQHPTKPGTVTVAGMSSDDVHPKTLASILRQAGLQKDKT
jgi:predicted RNA binding protein YcfA (HicA-like mRNA interferase family)